MSTNEERKIEDLANEIFTWIQSAVGDYAAGMTGEYNVEAEIEADRMYNDPDTLQDLAGDRIYDASNNLGYKDYESQKVAMWMIAEELKTYRHEALTEAMNQLQSRWEK